MDLVAACAAGLSKEAVRFQGIDYRIGRTDGDAACDRCSQPVKKRSRFSRKARQVSTLVSGTGALCHRCVQDLVSTFEWVWIKEVLNPQGRGAAPANYSWASSSTYQRARTILADKTDAELMALLDGLDAQRIAGTLPTEEQRATESAAIDILADRHDLDATLDAIYAEVSEEITGTAALRQAVRASGTLRWQVPRAPRRAVVARYLEGLATSASRTE